MFYIYSEYTYRRLTNVKQTKSVNFYYCDMNGNFTVHNSTFLAHAHNFIFIGACDTTSQCVIK